MTATEKQTPKNTPSEVVQASKEETYGLNKDLVQEITEALVEGKRTKVRDLIGTMHSADIAELINQVSPDERRVLVQIIKNDFDAEILVDLEAGVVDDVIEVLGTERSAEAITQLDSDDAVQVIEELHEDDQQELLEAIPQEQRQALEEGLSFGEESAGRLMNKQFVSIPESWDVGKTIDFLRQEESSLPTDFYEIFVTNKKNIPVGSVLVSRVIRSKRAIAVKDIMETDIKTIAAETDQEEAAYMFRKYALASAPVVDAKGRIVGVISVDDIVNVIEEEAEEDILRLAGVSETDLHLSSFFETAKKRFPWLFVNLLTAIAASYVISLFEGSIEKIVALAVLMPIVASMGGNAGTQTLTVAVRGIATKELTSTNARRVVLKEVVSSLINGLGFAVIVGAVTFVVYQDVYLSGVFALAMLLTLTAAGISGVGIPMLLVRMGVDPAIASAVFLTTVTDIVGFMAFLGLATLILL